MRNGDVTVMSAACEAFDLHSLQVLQTPDGVSLRATRYGHWTVSDVPTWMLEDSADPMRPLLDALWTMSEWLRIQPIINHDPGDEDRR